MTGHARVGHEGDPAQSVVGSGIYVPGSNGPGSEKPSIAWTFA
jgi:hypothetical protein